MPSSDLKSEPLKSLTSPPTMAYSNCQTRIIDLQSLNLPSARDTPDSTFCQIYNEYITANKSPDSPHYDNARQLSSAVLSLQTGIAPPVAFPTETVYGLGADATNSASIAGIFAAKGRPSDNPLIVHVSSIDHLERCLGGTPSQSAIPQIYHDLIREFWPGPLTILIPVPQKGQGVNFATNVHPGQDTIGFRIPSSPYARFLLAVTDRPIAGPSANSSGKPSPTTAKHVLDDLQGKINFILDGGSCDVGVESTVIDGLGPTPLILRPGGLSKLDLKQWGQKDGNIWATVENGWEVKKCTKRKRNDEVTRPVNGSPKPALQNGIISRNGTTTTTDVTSVSHKQDHDNENASSPEFESGPELEPDYESDADFNAAPRAPGMKYKHYAPKGRMILFDSITTSSNSTSHHQLQLQQQLQTTLTHHLHSHIRSHSNSQFKSQAQNQNHTGTIAFLTTTSWPPYAGLKPWLTETLFPSPDWRLESISSTATTAAVDSAINTTEPACLTLIHQNGSTSNSQSPSTASPEGTILKIYTLPLGTDARTISRNLFAGLRMCDDWGCDVIFAEAPTTTITTTTTTTSLDRNGSMDGNVGQEGEEFETVLERMRKAASEVVHLQLP